MMPINLLMDEHRLIERMVSLMEHELTRINERQEVRTTFIETAVDFFGTYGYLCHEGKEDILFGELAKKQLRPEDKQVMEDLIREHEWEKQTVDKLSEAKKQHEEGGAMIEQIVALIGQLAAYFPDHIAKEDDVVFPAAMKYFSGEEQEKMLRDFYEFDRHLLHKKYEQVIAASEDNR